jgi:hypothetical protein
VLIGERVGAVDVMTVTGGHCRVLISQALTDRRANAADTPGDESHSAVELLTTPMPLGVLLLGVQSGHDTSSH